MADVIARLMRGSTSYEADGTYKRRPENWREAILMLYPNGQAPLTALTALMSSESTDDPIFHWFEKELPSQRAASAGTGLSTTSLGGTTVAAGASVAQGATVYWQCASGGGAQFKVGHVVHLIATASGDLSKNRLAVLVTAVSTTGTEGITGKLINTNVNATNILVGTAYNVGVVAGSAYPEGDTLGTAISYDPSDYMNYTQIFRNSLENTRTASKTRLRTGNAVAQAKKEALELHSIEMERGFWFNPDKYVTTGGNGQPLRVTKGIYGFISTNKYDFRLATGIGSSTWLSSQTVATATYNWLMTQLEVLFRYGSQEKLGFCGSGWLMALQQLIAALPGGQIQLSPQTAAYGFNVTKLVTPFGTLVLKLHPLFTMEAAYRNDCVILDPKNLKYRYVDDTAYKPNRGANDLDGEKSEYLTEAGLEVNFEKSHAIINGLGFGATS